MKKSSIGIVPPKKLLGFYNIKENRMYECMYVMLVCRDVSSYLKKIEDIKTENALKYI